MRTSFETTRVSWRRWVIVVGFGAFLDCAADTDAGMVPPVAVALPLLPDAPVSPVPQRDLEPACTRCGRPCAADLACVEGACVPPPGSAPRLLLPASMGRVTTQRPTMRWVPTANSTGSLVEVCRDRACTEVVLQAERTDDRFRPEGALAAGVYFWRVRARVGSEYSRKASATWEFVVRPRDTPVDTTIGRLNDYNGDGYADVTVNTGSSRAVRVFLGGPEGVSARPDLSVPQREGEIEVRVTGGGDLDGDGFSDLLLLDFGGGETLARRVRLLRGGPRPALDRTLELRSNQPWARVLSVTGDLDGDGYADLLGVDPERDGEPARVRVWFGNSRGIDPEPQPLLEGLAQTGFASAIAGVGDLNGDTLPDLVIGAPAEGDHRGQAVAWINGRCARGSLMPLGRGEFPGGRLGETIALAGDLNGDGYADPVASLPFGRDDLARSAVQVFLGAAETAPASRSIPFEGAQTEGIRLVHGGDYNGDGWGDLVLWMHNHFGSGPRFVIFSGGPEGLRARPDREAYARDFGSRETALSVSNAGDTDRDGYDDLLVFLMPGEALIARGGPEGPRIAPTPLLLLP